MFENVSGRQTQSLILENGKSVEESPVEQQKIGCALNQDKGPVLSLYKDGVRAGGPLSKPDSDMELMKERFAKLLLGEDMSGGGKGVPSALALSNAITNLAASSFGEHKLEPISPEKKTRWRKEIDSLLSVTDHIVEFAPSQQMSKDGTIMEIMTTRQRTDLVMNIPALRKFDATLIGYLDNFGEQNEFWYMTGDNESEDTPQRNDKWWLPTAKVPENGLSDVTLRWLHFQKDSVNQVLKAAMAINAQVLSEMEIPENYMESLPKNGRGSLGDVIYKSITDEYFDPEQLLSITDLSTEHKVLDIKNRIEASIVIWTRKMHNKDVKSSWGSAVSIEKKQLFEERAQTILLLLKQRFPGLPQSSLDICKIQYNRDVGQAILESYSRIIESLAYNIISRIEGVLYADSLTRDPSKRVPITDATDDSVDTPTSKTLSDFMGWNLDKEKTTTMGNMESYFKEQNEDLMSNPSREEPINDDMNNSVDTPTSKTLRFHGLEFG